MNNRLVRCHHHVALLATTLIAGCISLAANADMVLFEDNFDAETLGTPVVGLTKWGITSGTVDVIGVSANNSVLWDLYPNNGAYIDLDGSCGNSRIESGPIEFVPGNYELSFEIGYNYYGQAAGTHVLDVYVGEYLLYSQLDPTMVSNGYELKLMVAEFTADTATTASLSFVQRGPGDCYGAILDDVKLSLIQPLLPTDAKQCKKDGWRNFGVFKNQGDCVSFVATKGKNPPAR